MEVLIEQILTYTIVLGLALGIVIIYLRKQKKKSDRVKAKIDEAKKTGLF